MSPPKAYCAGSNPARDANFAGQVLKPERSFGKGEAPGGIPGTSTNQSPASIAGDAPDLYPGDTAFDSRAGLHFAL